MALRFARFTRGLDVLVATPGRLLDHLDAGVARLNAVEFLVLDEVDQMLDLGFVKPIRRIVRELPRTAAEPVLLGDDAHRHSHARGRTSARSGRGRR